MKRNFYTLLSAVFGLTISVSAQAPTDQDTTLLWAISGNDLEETSYLFGTIHLIPEEDFFMPKTVTTAFQSSERVAFEIDMKEMEDPSLLFSIMGRLQMSDGVKIKDLIEDDEYQMVKSYFDSAGIPFAMFENWKPMFLSAMVGQDMDDMGFGGLMGGGDDEESSIRSYELELSELAEKGEKEVFGLETMDFQLNVFDSIPYEAQAQMLVEAVENDLSGGPTADNDFDRMVDMYKRQAISEMVEMIRESAGEGGDSNFEEFLLVRRNRAWIPLMAEAMSGGSVFFAVGAAHLGGEDGVIKLLRDAGYQVEGVYE
ncbi:MAG: TraB/GumN family protein [Bacteroidota bacterium]